MKLLASDSSFWLQVEVWGVCRATDVCMTGQTMMLGVVEFVVAFVPFVVAGASLTVIDRMTMAKLSIITRTHIN